MNTKQHYTAPESELVFDYVAMVLCASTTLDPLIEDNDLIRWDE